MRVSEPAMKPMWLRGETAVIGLARSGGAVATLLARTGSRVYASDAASTPRLVETAAMLRAEGVDVQLGGHDVDRIRRASLAVVSPGVPPTAPVVMAAIEAGVELVSEVEIALRFLPQLRCVAITGTNGKTTTTAMVAHLLRALGLRAEAAGNIGTPLSELACAAAPPTWVALEMSSFQLHDTPGISPEVGVLTNLSPNHLDRYATVEAYYADKALLFRNATAACDWVSNADDDAVRDMVANVPGLHGTFSLRQKSNAWYDRQARMLVVLGTPIIERDELQLVGDHNVANALAATLAVVLADAAHRKADALRRLADGLRSFRALEHRIEVVAEVDGITWINDSKSTNIESTLVALRGMRRPTVLLLGGRHKGEPYTALVDEIRRIGKHVVVFGEAAPLIEADLKGSVPMTRLGSSFDEVIAAARRAADRGDVVLLSPACSSYDMFANYEERGAEFKRLVGTNASLPGNTRV